MEELKQIISTESQDGENITLDEIQKLDKQKLAEHLGNIDSALKQSLLASLKKLITKEVSNGNAKNSPETVIFALQIFGKLQGFPMNIDGKYSQELSAPEFKKLYIETKTSQTSLSEKIGLPMEKLKDAKNLGEFLNITLETLLKKYAQKLSSPEGIPLKKEDIYKELVLLLHDIDKNLPVGNIFKGNSDTIIQNFLTPKENGELLIQNVLDKVVNPDRKEAIKSDIDGLKIALRSGLGTLIDIAKEPGSDAKLKAYVNEFKNIPKVKELLSKIPEFDKVFDLFLSLVKTLDKKELGSLLDTFFEKNTQNLLTIANNKPGEKGDDRVKLEVMHDAWGIVDGLIDKQRVSLALNGIGQFEFLKKNPIISQAIDIINNEKLSSEDKYTLFKEISRLVSLGLDPNLKGEQQSQSIKKSLNTIVELLSKFNKQGKIDENKVVKLLKEFINGGGETSLLEKIKKIKSITELSSFVADNFDTLKTFVLSSVRGKDGLEDAIKDFIRNYRLGDNISKAGGNLIERLEKAFQLNSANMILSLRNTLLDAQVGTKNPETGEKTKEQQAAFDIGSMFVDRISKKGFELMRQKLTSSNQNDKKLTKEDIVNTIFSGVNDIFKDKELSNSLFENAKKLGAKVDNKEKFIQNMISYFVNNPEFKSIINNLAGVFLNRLAKSGDVNKEIDAIKNDFQKLANDFAKNYSREGMNGAIKTIKETTIVDEKTKNNMLISSVSIVYEFMTRKENIVGLLQAFPEIKAKIPAGLSEEKTIDIATQFLKQIPKELISKIVLGELSQNKKIEDITSPSNILKIFSTVLSSPEVDKNALVQLAIDAKIGSLPKTKEGQTSVKLDKQTLANGVDTLYELLGKADSAKMKELTASLGLYTILGVGLDQVLKNVGKDELKQVLFANMDMLSGPLDMNKGLKFAAELYQKVPVEKRLGMVDSLISELPGGEKGGNSLKLSANNAPYITQILYATLETGDNEKIFSILKKFSPELGKILNEPSVLNNNNFTNGVALLNAISKDKFENFLVTKSDKIEALMKTGNKNEAVTLVFDLLLSANSNELKRNLSKDKKLSKNEESALDMAGSVQKAVEKHKDKLSLLVEVGQKIEKHFNSGEKDIAKNGLTQQEIKTFSENMFDLVSDTLICELQNIKDTQKLSSLDEAREKLASKFEIPKSNGSSKIDMSKISVLDFVMNNLGFSLKWGLSLPFQGMDATLKNAGIDYFLSPARKKDFARMTTTYFS